MNFFLFLFASYITGLLTFLAPCTLPILPIYLSMCLRRNFRSLTLHTLYLGIGVAIVYIVLGVFAGTIGSFVSANKRVFITIIGSLLLLVGFATFFGFSFTHILPKQKHFSPLGTIGYGMLFGLAWSGCIGPVLGGVLLLAGSTGTAFQGALLLLVYALGLLTPLFIISFISDRTGAIPKLWRGLYGKLYTVSIGKHSFALHTTNMIAGTLFIVLGLFFLLNGAAWLEASFPGPTNFVLGIEERIQTWLTTT